MKYTLSHSILSLRWLALTLLASALLCSCTGGNDTTPTISVSIQPQKFLLEKLVGKHFNVVCLLAQGNNPETYEPSMSHLMTLERSKAYFCIGNIPFELAIVDKAKKNNPEILIYDNGEGITLIHGSHKNMSALHEAGEHHHDVDPHIWTSVANARVIAQNMCKALCELDKKHAREYKKNLRKLQASLDELDHELATTLEPLKCRAFIVWHPSLSYFARDYGLKQISMEFEGKEMPSKYLKDELKLARQSGAKVFFLQKEFDSRQVETLNGEIGAEIVNINPMNYRWDDELKAIANALATAEND